MAKLDYPDNGILFCQRKERPLICVMIHTDLENIMLTEISQTQKDIRCVISLM